MSIITRIQMLLNMKASSALDRAEDPIETLDYAYSQQQELLRSVNRGLVEVVTAKEQLRQQAARLRGRILEFDRQAKQALAAEREDLARVALERKHFALKEIEALDLQVAEVADEERRLTVAQQRLSARVEEFRTHRAVLTARYGASEAQVRVQQSLAGVSGDFADLGIAVGRAEEKIERMRSRAVAIDGLIEAGTLGLGGAGSDPLERELRDLSTRQSVDDELAALRSAVAASEREQPAQKGDEQ